MASRIRVSRSLLTSLAALVPLAPLVAHADESDPACIPDKSSLGWTQPKNVPIVADGAARWPLDATIRVAYTGPWCPGDDMRITLVEKETGVGVPTEVRVHTPYALFHNEPAPLNVLDIDPIPLLKERTDYALTLRPPEPSLSLYEEYLLEFRTSNRNMRPNEGFAGISGVEAENEESRCWGEKVFKFADYDDMVPDPPCARDRRIAVRAVYQPLDAAEVTYAIYHTRSVALDVDGNELLDDPTFTDEATLVGFEGGASDQGNGVAERRTPFTTAYQVLPRRECFAVVMLDEWGREVGDVTNAACIDIPILDPCPQPNGNMQSYPPPNPFDVRTPVEGLYCEDTCLNGGDCENHEPVDEPDPPMGGGGGAGGASGDGGPSGGGGGAVATDGGPAGADGGSGSDGDDPTGCVCSTTSTRPGLGLALLSTLLLGFRLRSRHNR